MFNNEEIINECSGNLVVRLTSLLGFTGPAGVVGVTGIAEAADCGLYCPSCNCGGPTGVTGITGVIGFAGVTGITGVIGFAGVTGPTGCVERVVRPFFCESCHTEYDVDDPDHMRGHIGEIHSHIYTYYRGDSTHKLELPHLHKILSDTTDEHLLNDLREFLVFITTKLNRKIDIDRRGDIHIGGLSIIRSTHPICFYSNICHECVDDDPLFQYLFENWKDLPVLKRAKGGDV